MWVCIKIRKSFFFFDAHLTLRGIVIITDSFDVADLKKTLNRAVLQTANLSKVVKRRRRRKKGMCGGEEGNGERLGGEGGRGWSSGAWTRRSVRRRPVTWRDGGRGGQKWENE